MARKKPRGRCPGCKRIYALRKDHTITGHSDRPREPYDLNWCRGVGKHPVFVVGDMVANDHNDTVGQVIEVRSKRNILGSYQGLVVRKTAGTQGHAAIGDVFPESNQLVHLVEYRQAG